MSNITNTNQTDELQIDIFDIVRDVMKDVWLILIIGLSAAMCSYVVTNVLYKPNYSTSATFVVTSKGMDDPYLNLEAANTVATSLTKIFDSNVLKKKVAMDIGTSKVEGSIAAMVIPETNLLEISVSSTSPNMTYRIIKSIMKNYTVVTDSVYGSAILDLMEAPELPMYPNNYLDNERTLKLSFLIGVAAMTILLAALSITRDNVKNEKEVSKKLDTKIFGVVYHEQKYKTLRSRIRRKRKSILLSNPTVSFSFVEGFKKMRTKFEYKASQQSHKVLMVTSVLENEGKSTVASNMALALAQKSDYVLLIDADLSKPSIYKVMQKKVEAIHELGDCIKNNGSLEDIITYDDNHGVYMVLSSKRYENSTDLISRETFREYIEVAKTLMDYIIIDAPPLSVSADAELLADLADASLLVVRQSAAKTKDINDAIDLLNDSGSELLGCVYNDVHKVPLSHGLGYGQAYSYKGYYGKAEKS